MTAFASCGSPAAFHIWPEVRIIAGIDASMITSLGTCRLVMPRSESTIASAGPVAYACSIAAVISGSSCGRLASPWFGSRSVRVANRSLK